MNSADMLAGNQEALAVNALIGDPRSQRAVLEMAVLLAEAGIEPVEIFKRAAMVALKAALVANKLPPRPDARKAASDGEEFETARACWVEKLRGHPKAKTMVAVARNKTFQAINRALKRHSLLAKERALFDLAWKGEGGPDWDWMIQWERYNTEIRGWWREHQEELPPDVVDVLHKQSIPP